MLSCQQSDSGFCASMTHLGQTLSVLDHPCFRLASSVWRALECKSESCGLPSHVRQNNVIKDNKTKNTWLELSTCSLLIAIFTVINSSIHFYTTESFFDI